MSRNWPTERILQTPTLKCTRTGAKAVYIQHLTEPAVAGTEWLFVEYKNEEAVKWVEIPFCKEICV